MGLPGSGKTTLAFALQEKLNCPWFNADKVRQQHNDWDFSLEGRIRQSERMRRLADNCPNDPQYVIADFVAPTQEIRDIYNADYTIWVNTIRDSEYPNTDSIFEPPDDYDMRVMEQDAEKWAGIIAKELIKRKL